MGDLENIDLKQHQEQVAVEIEQDRKEASLQNSSSPQSPSGNGVAIEVALQTFAPGLSTFLNIAKAAEDIREKGASNSQKNQKHRKAKENALFIDGKKPNKAPQNKKLSRKAGDILIEKINITRLSVSSPVKGISAKHNTPKPLNTEKLKKEMARTLEKRKNPYKNDSKRLEQDLANGVDRAEKYNQTHNVAKPAGQSL